MDTQETRQSQELGNGGISHKLQVISGWKVVPNYKLVKYVGEGSYGQVVKAIDQRTNKPVAIKRIEGVFEDAADCKRLLREIILLSKLKHPSIVSLIDVFVDTDDLDIFNDIYLVMPYCSSDIRKLTKSKIPLDLVQVKSLIRSLVEGIKNMHDRRVVHRDLKPANILVNRDCTVQICDFGFGRSTHGLNKLNSYIKGDNC